MRGVLQVVRVPCVRVGRLDCGSKKTWAHPVPSRCARTQLQFASPWSMILGSDSGSIFVWPFVLSRPSGLASSSSPNGRLRRRNVRRCQYIFSPVFISFLNRVCVFFSDSEFISCIPMCTFFSTEPVTKKGARIRCNPVQIPHRYQNRSL